MEQAQIYVGPRNARLCIQLSHIAHCCRIETDTDQRSLIVQVSPQETRKVGIRRDDFVKSQQVMPIARLGKWRSEEEHIAFEEWAQSHRIQHVATGTRNALGFVSRDNMRSNIQPSIADVGKCLTIRRPLPYAIPATQFADGAHSGQQFTQQGHPLGDGLRVGAGKGRANSFGQFIK